MQCKLTWECNVHLCDLCVCKLKAVVKLKITQMDITHMVITLKDITYMGITLKYITFIIVGITQMDIKLKWIYC